MDALEALTTRKSTAQLIDPAPEGQDLEKIFSAAIRVPDHGCLRPWQFVIFKDEARAELGQIFCGALELNDPNASEAAFEKELKKPYRAPLVIVVIAKVQDHPKVPIVEQVLSAGAAAQNIMISAHALGFAGIWRTGAPCYDDFVRERLGATGEDQIVGFLYLGTAKSFPPMPDVSIADYVMEWKAAKI
ncbi:MAG: nitroreductase family protein [Sneathiella sp.]|nr:nitroreductase family protein [Sneathiella sp.]